MLGLPALSFKVLSFPTRNFKCMQFIPQWNLSYTSETAVSGRWVISHVVGHVTPLLYSTLLQECSAFSWGNGLRRQVCEVTYSDNTKPGAAWRANHSSGRNFLVKFFFFCSLFHISPVTYWLPSKSRDTQRENNIKIRGLKFLRHWMLCRYDLTWCVTYGRFDATCCRYLQALQNACVCQPSHVVTPQNTAILT